MATDFSQPRFDAYSVCHLMQRTVALRALPLWFAAALVHTSPAAPPSGATALQPATCNFQPSSYPPQQRPWAYWWWHGSAVDTNSLTHELERYRDAGMGGV